MTFARHGVIAYFPVAVPASLPAASFYLRCLFNRQKQALFAPPITRGFPFWHAHGLENLRRGYPCRE